jgi:hypothetical protein
MSLFNDQNIQDIKFEITKNNWNNFIQFSIKIFLLFYLKIFSKFYGHFIDNSMENNKYYYLFKSIKIYHTLNTMIVLINKYSKQYYY